MQAAIPCDSLSSWVQVSQAPTESGVNGSEQAWAAVNRRFTVCGWPILGR
jgi:hypothetical protein